jgi:glycosyltransferase involved in cell wall biosynthesis
VRVVHISPTYFNDASIVGGGERYVTELSGWMSRYTDTTLVSFSPKRASHRQGDLKVEFYPANHFIHGNKVNPIAFRYLSSVLRADVVHIHHIHTVVSDLSCLMAAGLRKPAFATDYGGGGSFVLNRYLPVTRHYTGIFAYSDFGKEVLAEPLRAKTMTIKGGIDVDRFRPLADTSAREATVLFVGRILPHKGINYLIDGFRSLQAPGYKLKVIGRVYDQAFYRYLQERAAGLAVEFIHDADDARLLREYQTAKVTVLPSVHRPYNGGYSPVPELMGFTLLESQACGTPALCTDAGAMKEFVAHGETGFVVEQNSGEAIATALRKIIQLSDQEYAGLSARCRSWVMPFSWAEVVRRHLETYQRA